MKEINKKDLSLAKLGIIALVDEATKYQEVRDKKELRKIYKKIVKKDNRNWYVCYDWYNLYNSYDYIDTLG